MSARDVRIMAGAGLHGKIDGHCVEETQPKEKDHEGTPAERTRGRMPPLAKKKLRW